MSRYRRQRRRRAPPDPEPWLRHLTPDLRDNPKSVAWAKARDETEAVWEKFRRDLMDFYRLHRACPHPVCRRARRCVHAEMTCYNAVEPLLRERVFPKLRAAFNKRAAEADMSPDSRL
jgi:hypothetical protein